MDGLKLISSMLETGSVETLRKVKGALFLDDELPVYQFVARHYRRYGQLPTMQTVEEETGADMPVVTEQLRYYLRKLFDRKLYNDLSPGFTELREALRTNDMDAAREKVSSLRSIIHDNDPDEDIRDLAQASRAVLEAYDDAALRPGVSGIPTGWDDMDEVTGGYQPGDLISWIGRPSMGKTYIMLKQADYAWRAGYNVLVVSMEMTITQIARRHAGMLSGINPEYIRKGQLSTHVQRRLRHQLENLQHADRFHLYAGGFSKQVADVEVLAHEFNPDILFIDGAYLMQPSNDRKMHRLEKVAEVMDEIKKMTITQNRPIVITSQFSRSAGRRGKEGSLESIGYTDAIGTHSSLVFAIKEGVPPYQQSRRVLELMKGREGESGEYQINYQFAPINFDLVPKDVLAAEAPSLEYMGED